MARRAKSSCKFCCRTLFCFPFEHALILFHCHPTRFVYMAFHMHATSTVLVKTFSIMLHRIFCVQVYPLPLLSTSYISTVSFFIVFQELNNVFNLTVVLISLRLFPLNAICCFVTTASHRFVSWIRFAIEINVAC